MSFLLVTPDDRIPIDATGMPLWLPADALGAEASDDDSYAALRISAGEERTWTQENGLRWDTIRRHLDQPHVAESVALLRFQEEFQYHPTTGEPLHHEGGHARSATCRKPVFPRIDPAVIGLVELEGKDKILLGKNRLRPDYYSLIAGYVNPGETLEAAWAREVLEETGRRVSYSRYMGSQPWPSTSSLMIAFRGTTTDEQPIQPTDGELVDIVWATRDDLAELPLATPGSIARRLIETWRAHD